MSALPPLPPGLGLPPGVSLAPIPIEEAPEPPDHYLNHTYGLASWLLTKDHKRIAILYLISVSFFFALGGLMAVLIRLELATPEGDLVQPDIYNRLFTMHGVLMIFFFLIPGIPGVLGNFLIPLMIGAKDLAFPKINLLSWYIYVIGGLFTFYALISGGIDTGWTFYAPLSTDLHEHPGHHRRARRVHHRLLVDPHRSQLHRDHPPHARPGDDVVPAAALRVGALCDEHHPDSGDAGHRHHHSFLGAERLFHVGIFDPKLGGDPVLFQHFFWFYSHPAVYIMILPAMGVVSELIAAFARKKIFGYKFVAFSSIAIAVLGFLVWAHHMFVAGISVYAAAVFSVLSMLVAIPSAVKVFNWTTTLYKGSISWEPPMLYALGFIGLFTIGGLTGVMLATLGIDLHVHDTYFIVAHFHYIMVGGAMMGYMGGLHYWWPKITGKLYPKFWAMVSTIDDLHRVQRHVLPAVPARVPRHAAPLSHVPCTSFRCST